jgi:hypothetical protein
MSKEDEESQAKILHSRKRLQRALEEYIVHWGSDPENANLQQVFNYFLVSEEIDTGHLVHLTPADRLNALDKLEKWYTDEWDMPFPKPKWLEKSREFWVKRAEENSR